MKNKKNLFIVNFPLQVLNALEAIYFFKLQNVIFVTIYNRSNKNIIQIKEQIKNISFDELIEVNISKYKLFEYIKLINKLKKCEYDNIFTGEIDDIYFRVIVANLMKTKLFLLDEGSSGIIEYETKIKSNNINRFRLKDYRFLLFGLKMKLKDTINFFTYYDFNPLKNGEVIRNKLEYMKRNFKKNNEDYSNVLFFLGQPAFISSDKNEVNRLLKRVINKYKHKKILYIPHREENLDDTVKYIKKDLEILEINEPIEKYFLNNGIYPYHVISYLSTALTTTKILYEDCFVEYIKIDKPNQYLKDVEILYTYFEKNNILMFSDN